MSQQGPTQGAQPSGISSIPVLAVAVVIIVFLAGIMIVLVASQPDSDLRADLDSTIVGDAGVVMVSVYGQIFNEGDQASSCTVTIRVWDGSGWQTFIETAGPIQPQESTEFVWLDFFAGEDPSEFEVKWTIAEA